MSARSPDRTCVVTGGASGIGYAVADLTLARDAFSHCAVLDLGGGRYAELLERHGPRVSLFQCDVSNLESVSAAFDAVDAWGPPISGLVNSAGVAHFVPTLELEQEDWRRVMDVNVDGTLHPSMLAAARMADAGGGAIVNLASVAGMFGWPRRAAYSTSKAAVGGLTRTLAVEWAARGIRVNAVAPGYIATELTEKLIADGNIDYDTYAQLAALNRFGTPAEVALPILFLLSSDAAFITGVTLPIDGGFAATKVP
jgi:NAD(P)-dependent dehydrogenase (short-subunit alcohol dehydrogenase family)